MTCAYMAEQLTKSSHTTKSMCGGAVDAGTCVRAVRAKAATMSIIDSALEALPAAAGWLDPGRERFSDFCVPPAGPGIPFIPCWARFPAGLRMALAAVCRLIRSFGRCCGRRPGCLAPWSLPAARGRAPATSTRPRSPGVSAETPARAGERWSGRGSSRQTCRLACAEPADASHGEEPQENWTNSPLPHRVM
jgi:hypothetical protein